MHPHRRRIDRQKGVLSESEARQLRLRDVRPYVDLVQVGDAIQRLPGLDELAGFRVSHQHCASRRVPDFRAADPLRDLRHLRFGGGHLRPQRLTFGPRGRNLASGCGNLVILRSNLVGEHAHVALGLIELLGGRRLVADEAPGPVVDALSDLTLRFERRFLRRKVRALRLEACRPFGELLRTRRGRLVLRRELPALDPEIGRIDVPTIAPAASVVPSSAPSARMRPLTSAETTIVVASTLPCASGCGARRQPAAASTAAATAAR